MTTRFKYLRGDNERIIVLAREINKEKGQIYYGMSICAPEEQFFQGFDRVLGRKVAEGRMNTWMLKSRNSNKTAGTVAMVEGQHPLDLVLEHLETNDPRFNVREIAYQELSKPRPTKKT